MKASVCFTPQSFDFNLTEEEIFFSLKAASGLIENMSKGFVSFFKSSDFDSNAAEKIYSENMGLDGGAIMSLLYDQQMNKASLIRLNETEVIYEANITPPVYMDTWISIYSSDQNVEIADLPGRTIYSEKCLVKHCSEVLVSNQMTHQEYAKSFVEIFNNLIFLDNPKHINNKTFDSIRKLEGGYAKFIKGITDCLNYMNVYEIIPYDSKKNIDQLNANLDFPVTPEGKGKNKRTIKALKRDFLVDNVKYDSVNCEYHYKLERLDGAAGKGTYYFNRIYFGFFNRIDINNPKIAIAHIGEHL